MNQIILFDLDAIKLWIDISPVDQTKFALTRAVLLCERAYTGAWHDDVIKWKHFPRYWPFVRGIHRSPVNSPYKGQCRGALMFSLICTRINGWINNRKADDLRRHRAHYDVIVMTIKRLIIQWSQVISIIDILQLNRMKQTFYQAQFIWKQTRMQILQQYKYYTEYILTKDISQNSCSTLGHAGDIRLHTKFSFHSLW